ncbi:MAG: nitrate reductase subunit beta, partial [Candidatus Nanopelagicales bacterium]|nr:nitrate reductase subunit beta [Candidatus Nanopelagicales bacterium]
TTIFANPHMPQMSDYYEPWTYDYEHVINAPAGNDFPVARPKSLITGQDMKITWGPNWDDDLGGAPEHGPKDPLLAKMEQKVKFEFEQAFMFYLPRICEHCLNPACVSSCPSGAMYKRSEDGIVLVDQDRCRAWRMCVSGCPYKKVYFNHKTGKSEKCTFCYPRIEHGQTTVCSETCVGRLRYVGVFLYDADRVTEAATVVDEQQLMAAQKSLLLDARDPEVIEAAKRDGIPGEWIKAAQKSPVYDLACRYNVALPLHPEYRTLPMVWYIPPLSPVVDALVTTGHDGEDIGNLFGAIDAMRIPTEYLAQLFTAGDVDAVAKVLRTLAAMRAHMRRANLGETVDPSISSAVGMSVEEIEALYRLLAIAKYEDRFVIPQAHGEVASAFDDELPGCSVAWDAHGEGSPTPVTIGGFDPNRHG